MLEICPMTSDLEVEDAGHADETHMSIDWTSCQVSTFDIGTPRSGNKSLTLCHRSTTIEPLDSPLFRVQITLLAVFTFLFGLLFCNYLDFVPRVWALESGPQACHGFALSNPRISSKFVLHPHLEGNYRILEVDMGYVGSAEER